ncbi:MAG: pilus assembly protein PilM [Verrucomicrobia bacterium]|nr:pilus assembly protein PilM [Verrucomicrobiota bacterium]
MALPFQTSLGKKRSLAVAVDLGSHTTKAVCIQRKAEGFELLRYAVQPAPAREKASAVDALTAHLKAIAQTLGAKTKLLSLLVGVDDSLLRHAEVPMMPVSDLRRMLKYGSKNYLQQDLPDYIFDCHVLPARNAQGSAEPQKSQKCRVLVGGARKQFLDTLQEAAKNAGLVADQVTPSLIGIANAFELAQPEIFAKEIIALVDLGFKHSTISILLNGELSLNRVVAIGGDRLTAGLAEAMNTSYAEAEKAKLAVAEEALPFLMSLLTPLGRELRASVDFFEKQEDKTVSQVFISGGSARSPFIVETLQTELMVPCRSWNPTSFLNLALPPEQMGEIEPSGPLLAVATGGAMAVF